MNRKTRASLTLIIPVLLAACAGNPPPTLGPTNGDLSPCPDSPNCVHTGHETPAGTPAWRLQGDWADRVQEDASSVMDVLEEGVGTLPRTRVVERVTLPDGDHYLHAESTSRIFRFVDDLELLLKPAEGVVVVRSASRVGHSDMGVNAARVATLRQQLEARGVLRP